jgi:hypothetical protein
MSKRGQLRASDEDRDHVIDRLREAASEGRIAAEELEQRVTSALKARTYGELDATVADLPGPSARGGLSRRSTAGWAVSTVRANPALLLFVVPLLAVTTALLLAATMLWAVMLVVFMLVGGRRRVPRGPWTYTWHHYGGRPPARRGSGSYWA